MPPRTANWLSNMEIDEISLVDRPANQHARVAIAKRADQEAAMPDYYDADGDVITDVDVLEIGQTVFDGDGNQFVVEVEDDEEEYEDDDQQGVSKSFAEQVREDLSKAFTDMERDDVISKALDEVSKADSRASAAESIAKSERDLRLTREYISKAADYGVAGVTPAELGPVLMRAAESLPYEDCVVLHKAFSAAGEAFSELGFTGGAGGENDPFSIIDTLLEENVSKSADGMSREAIIAKAFAENPNAYDEYVAGRNQG